MRARLGLARAALHEPQVLLLDEPTKSIDEAHLAAVHGLMTRCAARGGAVLVVTHSLQEAHALSRRIERLEAGSIVPSRAETARAARASSREATS